MSGRGINKYIVFEGNDGSGKTTIANEIAQKLSDPRIPGDVIFTKEPGSLHLQFCQDIRQLIIHGKSQNLDDITYAHLFYSDAHENLRQVVEPNLYKGNWVVSDRSVLSNLAYWPSEVQYVHRDHHEWFAGLKPLVFIMAVKPEECLRRMTSRSKEMNEFEKEHVVNKLGLIDSRYNSFVIDDCNKREIKYQMINNMRPIEDVINVVWGIILNEFNLRKEVENESIVEHWN